MSELFRERVIEPFVESYLSGFTPSPCILCNEHLKFAALIDEARRFGAEALATGHYARIERGDDGVYELKSGIDKDKDQSYFLFPALSDGIMDQLLFPVGGFTKDEVRKLAREKKLPVSEKQESQEVCFVPDDDYVAFIEEFRPGSLPGPGNIVDAQGNVLGRHRGSFAYTVGQRRGLGIGFGRRKYVLGVEAARNEVVLGNDDELFLDEMSVCKTLWSGGRCRWKKAQVKIRSTHSGVPASIETEADGSARVIFDEPQRAIAPGQAAVFYDGEVVIGGGWIV
jgi:tRNA-specific 2-thiouridylase